jgi:hypothetical protein
MAWNPSPEVAAARDFGKKFDADQVIIVYMKHKTRQMGSVTYGRTMELCRDTKPLGDIAYQAVREAIS